MAAYALFFSYTPQAWERMIIKPGDRAAAARTMIESAGGTLESLYFMLGDRDGFAVVHVPGNEDIAALSIAICSSGAFSYVETRALVAPQDLAGVLEKAAAARGAYAPPGE
ncbi:GYD domain-containing protein [Pseudonocardia yunnanensis]|jgi:uncharacterized protein with GYD domain|uniref:GYD domain-containing protein n=1 Tax=Pseudonocardia yunnanensis TaxID=58107 RepID=A0ABW4EZH3_9PSEU